MLAIEHKFEYFEVWNFGDHAAEREQRSTMDEALDRLETIRNKLPLVDHRLIAHAEACDLPGSYCSATTMRFLMRAFQLSGAEAASRVRAATALDPRTSMLGECLESQLPKVAALQADGAVTVEEVADLNNLTLYHTHFLQKGWSCRINADGLPE
jgi:Domain of unknown function (DUF222)